MSDNAAARFPLLVSREQARNKMADALRLFVGRGRRYSVKQLSNATGVPDWQINAAMIDGGSTDNRPLPPESQLSIAKFLGAEFTSEWLGLAGQAAFDIPDDDTPPAMSLAIDNADDNARLLHIAADNTIAKTESKDAAAIGRREITRGMQLVAAAAKASRKVAA